MKLQNYLFLLLLTFAQIVMAQTHNEEEEKIRVLFITSDYWPLSTFKRDTSEYFWKNFGNTVRYDDKTYEFFFNELEVPIKTICFGESNGEMSAFYFFFDDVETLKEKIRKDATFRGIQANFKGWPTKKNAPHLFNQVQAWGFNIPLEMTDTIRNFLKDHPTENLHYDEGTLFRFLDRIYIDNTRYPPEDKQE